ncbi:phenylalanine--tRNA ligase subunit alpha [Thalassospira marina]|uniref:Phenylalanine--tRNA ligase alpha subunit n=1 Tax=Thalassospira marina TaxID=2048283 RepID=A0A2N3KNI4_9PROT|nr:phenylalanine--tRNA ligase subunit alpha [Thalassospira marina]AUG55216.1 phenylalanine--tRNA ligase subunit alpha [Thalassospira marina]PKR52043.1 phenylalanine--tRNA ligase subunit alpha [Thalassospira marina]
MENIEALREEVLAEVEKAADLAGLEDIRISALGKKGRITGLMKNLGKMDPDQRREFGQALNAVKDQVASAIDMRKGDLENAALEARLTGERIDVTLPSRPSETAGRIHPISQTIDEIVSIFGEMGFALAEGPDIEDDFHNFTALNIPPEHPAREMQDTFYLPEAEDGSRLVLRTHTSPVQIRTMQSKTPPIRIIAPGRTYRSDSDMTHTPMFHQVEGLVIDKKTHMGHLKGCLLEFVKTYFELDEVPVRYRPSFFPFTEPSAEMDIGCSRKGGELKIGAGDDWLEILGCGMVHPRVLAACGLDPEEYQGFAFGMGIERIAMLKYGIPDLRTFFDTDLRWLKHYGFVPLDVPNMVRG